MKKILAATPHDAAGGFAIAGIVQRETPPGQLATLIDAAAPDDAIGVVAIDERLIDASSQEHLREVERSADSVIVVLPSPGAPARPEDDYARRLIRRAIGYQVKVQR